MTLKIAIYIEILGFRSDIINIIVNGSFISFVRYSRLAKRALAAIVKKENKKRAVYNVGNFKDLSNRTIKQNTKSQTRSKKERERERKRSYTS